MRELSLNLLDIAQNSIVAGATLITVTVEESDADDRLLLRVEDNGRGMTPEQLARVRDPFFTTRTTRKVGMGIPLFRMAAEMTGGTLTITSTCGVGTVITATFGLSHIDRMPLGDIGGTMSALIQMNPQLDFRYEHRVNDKEFVADTREFRETLGDVPLNEPEVTQWINAFLHEQISALGGVA